MNQLFKKSKEDVLNRWEGSEEVFNAITCPRIPFVYRYATLVATVCLLVVSYNYFGSSTATLEDIQLSDFYGDEEDTVTDELQDSYDFYEEIV